MEKLVISTQDLFDECLDIYEYNIDALSLHILFFKKENGNKKVFLSIIKKDLKAVILLNFLISDIKLSITLKNSFL